MPLITINVDDSIKDEFLKLLEQFPEDKIQLNDEAVIEELDFVVEDEEEDEPEYFMFQTDEEEDIMPFEFDILGDDEEDKIFDVQIEFVNGRRFIGFFTKIEDVQHAVMEEEYFFSDFIILPEIDLDTVRNAITELIYNEEFFDAFEEISEDDSDTDIDEIDPIRFN